MKKLAKALLSSVSLILLALSLCSCSILSPLVAIANAEAYKNEAEAETDASGNVIVKSNTKENGTSSSASSFSAPLLSDVTVCNANALQVIVTGTKVKNYSIEFSLEYKNTSEKDFSVTNVFLTMNGYQFDTTVYVNLPASSSKLDTVSFYPEGQMGALIGAVGEYGFAFQIKKDILSTTVTPFTTVTTKYYEQWKQSAPPATIAVGTYSSVTVAHLTGVQDRSPSKLTFYFALTNTASAPIQISIDQITVNGVSESAYQSYTVAARQTVLLPVSIRLYDLQASGVSEISTLGFQLHATTINYDLLYDGIVKHTLSAPVSIA